MMVSIVGNRILNILVIFFLLSLHCQIILPENPTIALKATTMDNTPLKEAGVGQPFLLHVIIHNAQNIAQYPTIKGIENFHAKNSGYQMNMVNNNTSITYHYRIRIDTAGTYVLGPARITEPNGTVESAPLSITVSAQQKSSETSKSSSSKSQASSLLRLTCKKDTAVIGQKIPCELTFFTTDPNASLQNLIEPDPKEIKTISIENKQGPFTGIEIINGIEHRYAKWIFDVYPLTDGDCIIPAYAVDYATANHNHAFSFFFGGTLKRAYSNTATIAVQNLPPCKQAAQFIGTIKEYMIKIDPKQASVGEGIVLTVQITGNGNMQMLHNLALTDIPPQLKWYESKEYTQLAKDTTNSTYYKEYIIQALHPGNFTIPAQTLFYYDTHEQTYKKISSNTMSFTIIPSSNTQESSSVETNVNTQPIPEVIEPDDLAPLALDGPITQNATSYIPWPVYWLSLLTVFILWFVYLLLSSGRIQARHYLSKWQSNKSIFNQTRKKIIQARTQNNIGAFYIIFIHFFAQQLQQPDSSVTFEQIERLLMQYGLSKQALDDWNLFFTQLAQARFYQEVYDAQFYDQLAQKSLYWIDIFQTLARKK